MNILKTQIEVIVGIFIFGLIIYFDFDFYKAVVLMLELMVIIEIVQMLLVFFKRERIKIRYIIDASLIFFIRELLILVTKKASTNKILLYVGLIGTFFFFRYLSLKITYKVED